MKSYISSLNWMIMLLIIILSSILFLTACDQEGVICQSNDGCNVNEYCQKETAVCDGEGTCVEIPVGCPDVWAPVCGCDGKTYGNHCEAASAGINVDFEGECKPDYCWDNEMCGEGNYCHFAECAQETGACLIKPEICIAIYDPVCGCDGKTYSSECVAASNGISVDYEGECAQVFFK